MSKLSFFEPLNCAVVAENELQNPHLLLPVLGHLLGHKVRADDDAESLNPEYEDTKQHLPNGQTHFNSIEMHMPYRTTYRFQLN